MNTDYIAYVLAVAKAGSINKAALKFNIPSHRLSKILTNMENEFNTKLFDRTHQGISLTADGEYFLEKFHQIDEIMTELKTHSQPNITSDTVSGKLTILCEPSFRNNYLLAAMNHFLSDYPDVQIAYYEYGHEELTEKLTNMPNTIGIVTLVKPLDERNYYQTLNISAYPLLRIMPTARLNKFLKQSKDTPPKYAQR